MAHAMHERLAQEAHIWLSRPADGAQATQFGALSADECRRANEIRHPRARQHFVAGRLLVRHVLSRYAAVEPPDWRFEPRPDGRPEIASPRIEQALRFNLSHSDDLVACVVTEDIDCGVDLESQDRRIEKLRIATHSFDPREVAQLEALGPAEQSERFFELWTLKEAYLKAVGAGIRLRLDAIRFEITPPGVVDHRIAGASTADNQVWQFAVFRPGPMHLLATAIRSGRRPPYVFRCWELDAEYGADRPVDLTAVARSPHSRSLTS